MFFPYWHAWHHIGCIQHTLPLLFDDCLTILEKLDALWCKLNDLIADYDEFKTDFEQWKGEVEDTIDDIIDELGKLDERLTQAEQDIDNLEDRMDDVEADIADIRDDISDIVDDIAEIRGDITDLGDRITTIEGDITDLGDRITTIEGDIDDIGDQITNINTNIGDLEDRIEALEDLLENLNIIVPEELFKENDIDWFISNVATPWLTQMGLSTSTYTPLRKILPVATDVGTIPAVSFKVGVLGFPIVYAKIPLMFSFTPDANITDSASFVQHIATDSKMLAFIRAVQNKSTTAEAFAPITLYTAPSFNPTDNIKFEGSYAIFEQPLSTSPTVGVQLLTSDTAQGIRTSDCRVSVRVRITQGSTSADMAIAVDKICAYYCALDGKVYIMLLSEHQ